MGGETTATRPGRGIGLSDTSNYCRECKAQRAWRLHRRERLTGRYVKDGQEHHATRDVSTWKCGVCGYLRLQYDGVKDVDQLCRTTFNRAGRPGRDEEDDIAHLHGIAWLTFLQWDRRTGVPFLAYCTAMLRNRLVDLHELVRERTRSAEDSLDLLADESGELGRAFGPGEGDPGVHRDPDLARALSQGGGRVARQRPPRLQVPQAAGTDS